MSDRRLFAKRMENDEPAATRSENSRMVKRYGYTRARMRWRQSTTPGLRLPQIEVKFATWHLTRPTPLRAEERLSLEALLRRAPLKVRRFELSEIPYFLSLIGQNRPRRTTIGKSRDQVSFLLCMNLLCRTKATPESTIVPIASKHSTGLLRLRSPRVCS